LGVLWSSQTVTSMGRPAAQVALTPLTAAAAASETALPVVASLPVSEKMVISLIGDPGQDAADPAEPAVADAPPPEEPQPARKTAAALASASPAPTPLDRRTDRLRGWSDLAGKQAALIAGLQDCRRGRTDATRPDAAEIDGHVEMRDVVSHVGWQATVPMGATQQPPMPARTLAAVLAAQGGGPRKAVA
jgi:hypothetical protein